MRLNFTALALATVILLPVVALGASTPTDFKSLVSAIVSIITILIGIIFALTFLVFIWGVVKSWIIGGGDTESVENGKKIVVTGIVALTVMVAIWGILAILKNTFFG